MFQKPFWTVQNKAWERTCVVLFQQEVGWHCPNIYYGQPMCRKHLFTGTGLQSYYCKLLKAFLCSPTLDFRLNFRFYLCSCCLNGRPDESLYKWHLFWFIYMLWFCSGHSAVRTHMCIYSSPYITVLFQHLPFPESLSIAF